MNGRFFFAPTLCVGVLLAAAVAHADGILGLGSINGARSTASAISGDGRVIFGLSGTGPQGESVRWTVQDGAPVIETMARPPGFVGMPIDASTAGDVAVMRRSAPSTLTQCRWDAPNTPSEISVLPEWQAGYAYTVAPDGTVLGAATLADGTRRLARWDRAGVPQALPLPEGASSAYHVIADANGNIYFYADFGATDVRLCRMSVGGPVEILTPVPYLPDIYAVSADGSTVLGNLINLSGDHSYDTWVWTAEHGFVFVLETPVEWFPQLTSATPNGSAVFGAEYRPDGARNFVWQRGQPLITPDAYFAGRGVDLEGWSDLAVNDVSDDGKRFVGAGVNPEGIPEAFVITIGGCSADFNGDDAVNSQDFFDFLGCFFDPACEQADFNDDHAVNSQDLFDFLAAFFAGC